MLSGLRQAMLRLNAPPWLKPHEKGRPLGRPSYPSGPRAPAAPPAASRGWSPPSPYLLSDLSTGVIGEVHFVDSGYNIIAMLQPDELRAEDAASRNAAQ
jgi:hypothetical protein